MSMVLTTEIVDRKHCGDQLSLEREAMSPAEAQSRLQRINGALRVLYIVGERLGSRRLQAAALDAMNAARGLA
jgi:hypothetical protein